MGRMLAHREQPIPVLSQRRSDVSPSLDAVFAKMVAKTADQRYQTMAEVILDLEACRSGGSVTVMTAAAPVTGTDSSTGWSDFLQTLDSDKGAAQAAAIPAVTATSPQSHPQPASETLSSSLGQDTLGERTKPTQSPQKVAARQSQKLVIGGVVAGMLLLGLLIWAFSGGEKTNKNGSNAAAKSKSSDGPPLAVAPLDTRQAKSHQQAWAKHLGVPVEKKVELPGGGKMTFMLIPPGEFMMGSSDLELERLFRKWTSVDNRTKDLIRGEGPQHRVRITRPFYLGKYEVTQSQWQAVMNNNPSANNDSLSHPVEKVSWTGTQSFLDKLNQHAQDAGTSFALPTEAQWEYACRAGTKTSWHWGDSYAFVDEYAWYSENSEEKTHSVGELKPNTWNLYDMHGNVREWCADLVDSTYYKESPTDDPSGPLNGASRVLRGASWRDPFLVSRSACREGKHVGYEYLTNGFRVAMTIDSKKLKNSSAKKDPNRRAAEWVLSIGGSVETDSGTFADVGSLPKEPFQVTAVDLIDNRKLTSGGLQQLEGLTKLTHLSLDRSSAGDGGLIHLRNLETLEFLHLGHTQVSDLEMQHLAGLTKLTDLTFSGQKCSDAGLEHLKALTHLTNLHIDHPKASGTGFVHLKGMTKLTSLAFAGKSVSDAGLEHIGKVTSLEVLWLSSSPVGDAGVKYLASLKNLRTLHISGSNVGDTGMESLKELTNLTELGLASTRVSDAGLEHLKGLPKLQSIILDGNQITDAGIAHLEGMPKLNRLNLRKTQVTAQGVAELIRSLKQSRIDWDKGK